MIAIISECADNSLQAFLPQHEFHRDFHYLWMTFL